VKLKGCLTIAACLVCSAALAQWQWEPGDGWRDGGIETRDKAVETPLTPPIPQAPESAPADYANALVSLKAGDNAAAAKDFDRFLKKNPASALIPQAHFWRGVALKRQGKLWKAHEAFLRYMEIAPGGELKLYALREEVAIGRAFIEGAKRSFLGLEIFPAFADGIDILTGVAVYDPAGVIARDSSLLAADRLFDAKKYEEARIEYESFITSYPESRHFDRANLRRLECRFLQFTDTEHDVAPLAEARDGFRIIERTASDFAVVEKAKEYLKETVDLLAQHDFAVALYYLKQNKTESGAFYLRSVAANYPDTRWAQRARTLLEKLNVE